MRGSRTTRVGGALAVCLALAACSSGSKSAAVVPASAAATTAGASSAAAVSGGTAATMPAAPTASTSPAGSAAATTSTAPSSNAPATTTKATTPPAKATTTTGTGGGNGPSGGRFGPDDPGVKAARAWLSEAAKAVNAGKLHTPALDALMTTHMASQMQQVLGDDLGLYYPGPLPSKFLKVTSFAPGQRIITTCDVLEGFAQDKKTHKPARKLSIAPGEIDVLLVNGKWKLDASTDGHGFSCTGVKVAMPTW